MEETQDTILITGASGFIGCHMQETLANLGQSGFALFRNAEPISSPGFSPIKGDLSAKFLEYFFKQYQPKIVFHFAGLSDPMQSDLHEVNVNQYNHLLQAVKAHSPKTTIVLMSSAAVYGQGVENTRLSEVAPPHPINRYGQSKLEAEKLTESFIQDGGHAYIARAFNVIGSGQSERFFLPSLCKKFVKAMSEKGTVSIQVVNPDHVRDFLDVRDLTRGLYELTVKKPEFGIYNFCSGQGRKIKEVADELFKIVGDKNLKPEYVNLPDNEFTIRFSVGNPEKSAQAFQWKMKYDFRCSVLDVWNSYRKLA